MQSRNPKPCAFGGPADKHLLGSSEIRQVLSPSCCTDSAAFELVNHGYKEICQDSKTELLGLALAEYMPYDYLASKRTIVWTVSPAVKVLCTGHNLLGRRRVVYHGENLLVGELRRTRIVRLSLLVEQP